MSRNNNNSSDFQLFNNNNSSDFQLFLSLEVVYPMLKKKCTAWC